MTDPDATRLEKAMRGKRTNVYAAGLVAALAGLSSDHLRSALADVLGAKSADVIEANMAALAAGIHGAASVDFSIGLAPADSAKRWLITGNQAVGLGALRAGVRFVGCYPITPATDLVEWLAPELQRLGGRLVLAEEDVARRPPVLVDPERRPPSGCGTTDRRRRTSRGRTAFE